VRNARLAIVGLLATVPLGARSLTAQSIAAGVNAVRDGIVLLTFAARPGVCGDGTGNVWTRNARSSFASDERQRTCVAGPVRVALGRTDGQTISVRKWVGGRWTASSSETNLGDVSPADAARYLIELARTVAGTSAGDAISAAAFADQVNLSPEFSRLVRDSNAPLESRKQALYWLGDGDVQTAELAALYADLKPFELREHFTFVISQRHDDLAIEKLIDVAKHDRDLEIRKRAMFWLGQSGDPRALKFLQDILTR